MQLQVERTCVSYHSINIILSMYPQRIFPNFGLTFWVVISTVISDGIERLTQSLNLYFFW